MKNDLPPAGWPRFTPEDSGGAVRMASAFAARSGRRVDRPSIATPDRVPEDYRRAVADA